MLCQQCQKHPATTHIKRTVNGVTNEVHLCAACAKEQGFSPLFGGMGMELNNFWGNLFSEPGKTAARSTKVCNGCGATFAQIAKTGKVGCPTCYETFFDRLQPTIERIHGKATHIGKRPTDTRLTVTAPEEKAPAKLSSEEKIQKLQKELEACIAAQEYERCAALRDEIQALKAGEEDAR